MININLVASIRKIKSDTFELSIYTKAYIDIYRIKVSSYEYSTLEAFSLKIGPTQITPYDVTAIFFSKTTLFTQKFHSQSVFLCNNMASFSRISTKYVKKTSKILQFRIPGTVADLGSMGGNNYLTKNDPK